MDRQVNRFGRCYCFLTCLFLACGAGTFAQTPTERAGSSGDASIEAKVNALSASLDETRTELSESREEIRQLRTLLEQLSQKLNSPEHSAQATDVCSVQVANPASDSLAQSQATTNAPLARITQDDWDVLNSRMEQQQQIKVESSSKFPVRLSGMFLLNTVFDSGRVDNVDVPSTAVPGTTSFGSMGFSLRQSIIGIEGTGPHIVGADTSADLQADFFGGMTSGYGASGSGLMRLRLARMRMDWDHTSLIGGLDTPFFSPNSPTSYLTVAEPGFSAAGNLWTWAPQIRVEQRFDTRATQLRVEAGLVDAPSYVPSLSGNRVPNPVEASRQPAYALRLSANGRDDSRPTSIGIAGVYLTQRFPGAVKVMGGGGMLDWNFPVLPRTEFSGELFTGKGLDGFGAAPVPVVTQTDYTQYITSSALLLSRVPSYGGWSQLTFRINSSNEINLGFGAVGRNASDFREAAQTDSIIQTLAFKNGSLVINYIFRPRSDLIFSAEYRRLRTYQITGSPIGAGQTGLTAGFLF
ncbi:MAG TPA: hypothetical protein VIY69_13155 [Candidatus Acidoferrales bacterium]